MAINSFSGGNFILLCFLHETLFTLHDVVSVRIKRKWQINFNTTITVE